MIKTSVIGFPRIGEQRELKRVTESYFKGAVEIDTLLEESGTLKKKHWLLMRDKGIDFIPSNDFSFYDTLLDTAAMFNIVPARFSDAGLQGEDAYFAMAKGYQKGDVDLKALDMKKWFNTNYHYIVPEIEAETDFKIRGSKIFDEYKESSDTGVTTKPVIIGPFTLLNLARIKDPEKNYMSYIEDIVPLYVSVLDKLSEMGVEIVQIDEPYLVRDLKDEDIEAFVKIYDMLFKQKSNCKILLQTYFGDIRDVYSQITAMPFDAIGLDFIEGSYNSKLIEENGFPKDKLLFAGVVNGKNIWNNDYHRTLNLLNSLNALVPRENIVISTSCSLLHVPYSVRFETGIDEKYKIHLSFAEEKLTELRELSELCCEGNWTSNSLYKNRQKLIQQKKELKDFNFQDVRDKVGALKSEDFSRNKNFQDRNAIQFEALDLPVLPTTTIGSFPQTGEVRKIRSDFKKGAITVDEYNNAIKEKISDVVKLQEEIGLDVLVHGEFERNDMVEYFGENLTGFLFTKNGWVQSYGTRGVKPPIIFGDVKREKPITVEWIEYAQSLTDKPVKGMLTGPVTILNWSFPREDLPLRDVAFQIALAIREEVEDLERNGITIIQIDEAALREKLPIRKANWHQEYLEWAVKAFKLTNTSVKPETQIQTHMCYSEFSDIMKEIKEMDADVILIEAAKSDLSILDSLNANEYDKNVGPGVYDIHSPRIPGEEEIVAMLDAMKEKIEVSRLWVTPDCGLKTRQFEETVPSLTNMVKAAKKVRGTFGK